MQYLQLYILLNAWFLLFLTRKILLQSRILIHFFNRLLFIISILAQFLHSFLQTSISRSHNVILCLPTYSVLLSRKKENSSLFTCRILHLNLRKSHYLSPCRIKVAKRKPKQVIHLLYLIIYKQPIEILLSSNSYVHIKPSVLE